MIYSLIGRATVKFLRYWIARKAPPSGTLLATAGVIGGLVVVAAVLVTSGGEDPAED
jgi:hypothetical protein